MSLLRRALDSRRRELGQDRVAGRVAERVVDLLEVVDVDEEHPTIVSARAARFSACTEVSISSRRLGSCVERVVIGEMPDMQFDCLRSMAYRIARTRSSGVPDL